jgi:hypothetical protein
MSDSNDGWQDDCGRTQLPYSLNGGSLKTICDIMISIRFWAEEKTRSGDANPNSDKKLQEIRDR